MPTYEMNPTTATELHFLEIVIASDALNGTLWGK